MKTEIKAALYSGIVFPGSGYFFTKEKMRGYLCILTSLTILFILMRDAWYKAQIIANKIVSGELAHDINVIREQIHEIPSLYPENVIMLVYTTLFLVWIVSIFDSYRLAKTENT